MKKIFMLFGALMLLLTQAHAQDCPFQVQMNVISATCYNNGMVTYALMDGPDNVLTSNTTGLKEVRAYYIEQGDTAKHFSGRYLVDASGNMNYANGWDTLTIDYGTYTIGVEGLCDDGNGGYIKKDTQAVLTIPTTYTKPFATALGVMASPTNTYGRLRSLTCRPTGRIQLKIENGSFPYTVTVKNHNTGETIRTVTFDENQYHGTNDHQYDYKDYYTFDSLPKGDYDFYVVDGCGYGLPRVGQQVTSVSDPVFSDITGRFTSGNNDSIALYINAVLSNWNSYPYFPNMLPDVAAYRIVLDGEPLFDWKPFPAAGSVQFTDTVAVGAIDCHINDWDIWDKPFIFQYKINNCTDTLIEKTFTIQPNLNFVTNSYTISDSVVRYTFDCQKYGYAWWHTRSYSIQGKFNNSDHNFLANFFSYPLTWVYTDLNTNTVIKRDTITDVRQDSYLRDRDVEAIYGDFHDSTVSHPLRLNIERKLVDANGCVIHSQQNFLHFYYSQGYWEGTEEEHWFFSHILGDKCCTKEGELKVYTDWWPDYVNHDGVTIELYDSPLNNLYNFTAVYHSSTHSWSITRHNMDNMATISGAYDGKSLKLSDYCMPAGLYEFRVITPCTTQVLSKRIDFYDVSGRAFLRQEPVFSYYQQCTDRYITYTQGQFAHEVRHTNNPTNDDTLVVEIENLQTKFQIIDGPTGGYDNSPHNLNQEIRISMLGDYRVRIYAEDPCGGTVSYYDTIHYDGANPDFEYAYAFLCDSTSTTGTAYVKGTEGTPPYTYILYDAANLQGNVIETITVSDPSQPAIFANIAMNSRQALSCLIQDACGAYFHLNFYPRTLADVQKVWFDGGLTLQEACEGSSVSVHALDIASILQYEWYNPDNELIDSVSSPSIFIPRGAQDGWYKVVIRNSGCADSIVDSVYLDVKPAPTIHLASDVVICPGEEADFYFTPTSPTGDPLTFTIAFENADGVETRNYNSASEEQISDSYRTFTNAKIYPLSVNDGNCDYTLADENDTIHVTMKTNIAGSCIMIGTQDTVCYGANAQFQAKSTVEPPYTIRWYTDYEMTSLLKTETISDTDAWSYYNISALTHHEEVYFTIEKEGYCPMVYGLPTQTVNFSNGSTALACGQTIRLYDDGGPNGDYSANILRHTYTSTDGKPVNIHFEEFTFSNRAFLAIYTGSELNPDSILYTLTAHSPNPGMITSNGNTLTLRFNPGTGQPAAGWKAIVEPSPGKSIADVWDKNEVFLRDEVCQSQTNTYYDWNNVVPSVVTQATLNSNLRTAGTYTYSKTFPGTDVRGCDSIVRFTLVVTPPETVTLRDEVCQSQTNIYDDPYGVTPSLVDLATLNKHLRKPGTYTYSGFVPGGGANGCDINANFILKVNPPVHHDTTVVTTNIAIDEQGGYLWPTDGRTYTTSGLYYKRSALPDGCDSLDVLELIVLEVDTTTNEICRDDSTRLAVSVTVPDLNFRNDEIPPKIAIGDVLCTDGSIMKLDSFKRKFVQPQLIDTTQIQGVVFYVDPSGNHGLAVALADVPTYFYPYGQGYDAWGFYWGSEPYPDTHHGYRDCWLTGHHPSDMTEPDEYATLVNFFENNANVDSLTLVALQDTAGYKNTQSLVYYSTRPYHYHTNTRNQSQYPIAAVAVLSQMCYYYGSYDNAHQCDPTKLEHSGWYMPGLGELNLLYASLPIVQNQLQEIQSTCTTPKQIGQYDYVYYFPLIYPKPLHVDFGGDINSYYGLLKRVCYLSSTQCSWQTPFFFYPYARPWGMDMGLGAVEPIDNRRAVDNYNHGDGVDPRNTQDHYYFARPIIRF